MYSPYDVPFLEKVERTCSVLYECLLEHSKQNFLKLLKNLIGHSPIIFAQFSYLRTLEKNFSPRRLSDLEVSSTNIQLGMANLIKFQFAWYCTIAVLSSYMDIYAYRHHLANL